MALEGRVDEAVSKRMRCAQIKNHPFYTRVIFGVPGVPVLQDHPLSRLVQFLIKYEVDGLFQKHDQTTKGMRRALGWQQPGRSALSPEDVAKLDAIDAVTHIQKDAWDNLCSLFTTYRLIDAFTVHGIAGQPWLTQDVQRFAVNEPRQRFLEEDMVRNIRGWEKLKVWPKLLSKARSAMETPIQLTTRGPSAFLSQSNDNPHLSHLFDLSGRDSQYKHCYILDNFQAAALHLSYIMKMPGKEVDGTLPDIPFVLEDLLKVSDDRLCTDALSTGVSADFANDNTTETKSFLADTTALQLRLPLQYALSITPLCLFFPFALYKTRCDRSSLLKASVALGNIRPFEIRELDKEILSTLARIASKPADLKSELKSLVSSTMWQKLEVLPASNPAFHFFDPSYITASPLSPENPTPLRPLSQLDDTNHIISKSQSLVCSSSNEASDTRMNGNEQNDDQLQAAMISINDAANQVSEKDVPMAVVDLLDGIVSAQSIYQGNNADDGDVETKGDAELNTDIDMPFQSTHRDNEEEPIDVEDGDNEKEGLAKKPLAVSPQATRQSVRIQTKIQNEIEEQIMPGKGKVNDISVDTKSTTRPKRKVPSRKDTASSATVIPIEEGFKNVIDVDLWAARPITLDVQEKPSKISGRTISAYGPTGEVSEFVIKVHDYETLYNVQRVWTQVENTYKFEKPLHLSDPEHSGFRVLSQEKAATMKPKEWLSILKTQCIVVTGGERREQPFKRALQNLGVLSKTVMTIQDQSIPAHDDYNKRCFHGTFSQILKASRSPEGKILNALDIGLPCRGLNETGYASNVSALMATSGGWKTTKSMPMEEINWALAATSGAFHTWHIDCNGFTTFVSPVCGAKLWIIGRPHNITDSEKFADINLFLEGFGLQEANEDLWTLEAVLLKPGDTLIMRPNTPHAVYTPTATVAHGGHCYSSSTLQASLVGMVHAFIASSLVTNTNHPLARFHLQQMIDFFHLALVENGLDADDPRTVHVPDCCSRSDFINLMAICMFGILINVLDFATYQYPGNVTGLPTKEQQEEMVKSDINALTDEERWGCTYTRGQALQIMDFVARNFKFADDSDLPEWTSVQAYQEHMIVSQCRMIYNYKVNSRKGPQEERVSGAPGCSVAMLRLQLSGVLNGDINAKIKNNLKITSDSRMQLPELSCGLIPVASPLPANSPLPVHSSLHGSTLTSDPRVLGLSLRDQLYRDSIRIKSESEGTADIIDSPPRKRKKL